MKRKIILLLLFIALLCAVFLPKTARADELTDEIENQLENLDLSELEEYYSSIRENSSESIIEIIKGMLNGEYDFSYKNIFSAVFGVLTKKVKEVIPPFLSVVGIAIFLSVIKSVKGAFLSEGVFEIIFIACFSTVVVILFAVSANIFIEVKNNIENLAKLSEIMSPIILTLMIASGGNTSAAVFKPSVLFLSGGIIEIVLCVILPLVSATFAFTVLSYFSKEIKLKKFTAFFGSVIKWIIGIIITVYGVFLTVQGIGSAVYDGISVKTAKYLISNSVPMIGGFLRDGFDLVVAGSVLIKNSVGIAVLIALFYTIISPIILIAAFSLLLNFTASVTETLFDERISDFCTSLSKCFTYLSVALIMVGIMFFITVLLMIVSANGVL